MSPADVSLCVINRNGERNLPFCLEAVRQCRSCFGEVLLVDDASTDRSVDVATRALADLRVVRLGSARGPGGARNVGFRETAGRWVLFLDSDMGLDARCPGLLLAAARERAADFAVPAVLWAHAPDEVQFDGAGAHFLGLMILTHAGADVRDLPAEPREIGSLTTGCFLLDRTSWTEPGPFDESFLFNLEDHDLGLRARLAGKRILSVPAARVLHGTGTDGFSIRGDQPAPATRTFCLIRNRWLILLKDYQLRTLVVLAPILLTFEAFQILAVVRKGWGREWLRAAGWIVGRFPTLLQERRRVQAERVRPDREILEAGPLPFRPALVRTGIERRAIAVLQTMADGYWTLARRLL